MDLEADQVTGGYPYPFLLGQIARRVRRRLKLEVIRDVLHQYKYGYSHL